MNDITEELLKVDLNPPPLKRQYAKNNLLSYLNVKNQNNNYNELQEVVLDDDLYRSFVIQRNNEEVETEKEN